MATSTKSHSRDALTLIELLCVIAIIMVLAGLLLGPATRALSRLRADQWGEESSARLDSTVEQLRRHFRGRADFPQVTLEEIESKHLVGSQELAFLKDHRVTFFPFAGSDPDNQVVIHIDVRRGYWTDPETRTALKGTITSPPE